MDLTSTYRAVVTLYLPAAEWSVTPGSIRGLEAIDDRRCRLTSHTDTPE